MQGKSKKHLAELLKRAGETGLLTHLGAAWYTIHPALPWFFRQIFTRHYDGQDGRSTAQAALRAWVEAVGELGSYYHRQFNEGNRDAIEFLTLEEANLLHTRRTARRHGWWSPVTFAMQGLQSLYQYQGRGAEWARLVTEIVPDYCTDDNEPVPGRENDYSLVMGYRVNLAQRQERDLAKAAALQEKRVAWNRRQAAATLALPEDVLLDDDQRNRIRTLSVSLENLGQILHEQGRDDCVKKFEESIRHCQRIKDTAEEAANHYNLGHAYKNLTDIHDLDAAEAAYQDALKFYSPDDNLYQSAAIQQIGMVHHERFHEARRQGALEETLLRHVCATVEHYQQALDLCPPSAIAHLGPKHNQLGNFYAEIGQTEKAREQYEKRVQYAEQTDDRHSAGQTRYNMALMYLQASGQEESRERQRDLLVRARAYAEAALRDFQHYQGHATAEETDAQQLIDRIQQAIT